MTETNKDVYLARSMPEPADEPIYAFRIGNTLEATKDAIEEATEEVAPLAVNNLNWDDDSAEENARAKANGWYFQVNKYDLHEED